MIIFTPLREIPTDLLELKRIKNVVVYNLSSYIQAPTLNLLIPSDELMPESVIRGDCTDPSFDTAYHSSILNNDGPFSQLMQIMIPVFQDPDVLVQVLINTSEYRDAITESLLKLIQQRYGYNAYIINNLEDFIYAEESSFSIPGLFMMDKDLMRWQSGMPISSMGDLYE